MNEEGLWWSCEGRYAKEAFTTALRQAQGERKLSWILLTFHPFALSLSKGGFFEASKTSCERLEMFWVYILRCSDGSYYTGHTDNLESRIAQHQSGECEGYTATRLPVELV